jgi:hypothetical protein
MNADGWQRPRGAQRGLGNVSYCNSGAAQEMRGARTAPSCWCGTPSAPVMAALKWDHECGRLELPVNSAAFPRTAAEPGLGLVARRNEGRGAGRGGSASSSPDLGPFHRNCGATTSMNNSLPGRQQQQRYGALLAGFHHGGDRRLQQRRQHFCIRFEFQLIATINTLGHENMSGGYDAFWWSPIVPGTLASMTLGVSSIYINACANYTVNYFRRHITARDSCSRVQQGRTSISASGDGDSTGSSIRSGSCSISQTRAAPAGPCN